jgi:methionine-R-sulfoxide reductase
VKYELKEDQYRPTLGQSTSKEKRMYTKPPEEELKKKLTPLQYEVTQHEGTERPFQNEYWDNHKDGIYVDRVSGEPLFSSKDKYDSRTGWPSFTKPLDPANIVKKNSEIFCGIFVLWQTI